MKSLTLAELARALLEGDNYIILTHRRPDGDTIGSAAALCRGLRSLGKTAAVLENPQLTEKFRPYLKGLTVKAIPEGACLIAADIAAQGLLPLSAPNCEKDLRFRIDHHGQNESFGQNRYVVSEAAACGELIMALLQEMGAQIDKKTAEALYLAISTDTGCFRYSNVTANTLRCAALCKDFGADTFSINRVMFSTKRLPRLKLDAFLTETTEFYAGGKVAISAITHEIRQKLGVTEDDTDDISGFGREIEGVQIGIMLQQISEGSRISVRTSPSYDAGAICALLGGGGHKAAAGATVEGGIQEAKKAVMEAIRAYGVDL